MKVRIYYRRARTVSIADDVLSFPAGLDVFFGDAYQPEDQRKKESASIDQHVTVRFNLDELGQLVGVNGFVREDTQQWKLASRLVGARLWEMCTQLIREDCDQATTTELSDAEVEALRPLWRELHEAVRKGQIVAMPAGTDEEFDRMLALLSKAQPNFLELLVLELEGLESDVQQPGDDDPDDGGNCG